MTKPPLMLKAVGESFIRDFDGNVAIEARIVCAVNFAHAARTEWSKDFVGAELVAGRKWHMRESA